MGVAPARGVEPDAGPADTGLGAAWTTVHLRHEQRAAELLGIPYQSYTQGGLFPIAYTAGTDFRLAARRPLSEVMHWDHW